MKCFWKHKTNTILDYGAKVYKSKDDALNGKSSSNAIQKMVDDLGYAILPFGWMKHDEPVIMYGKGQSIIGQGQGNKGVNLITNKSINLFRPIHANQEIRGFTAHYVGDKTKECAVIYLGSEHKGGLNSKNGSELYHRWKNRNQNVANYWDFDFEGDYNANPIWINYEKESDDLYSCFHMTKIRGFWRKVDTGIKINRKAKTQSMNTLNVDVYIWGYNKMADIRGINFSKINIMGQLSKNIDNELFYVEGEQLKGNIFTYVESYKYKKGNYHVKDLDLSGYFDLLPYKPTLQVNLNDSIIII